MAKASPALTSFASGELSPQMEGRIDVDKYPIGCHKLENFLPLVEGPAKRRAGTKYVAEVKDSTKRAWLRRFEYSSTQAFQIEFNDGCCRFYTNHGQLQAGTVTAWSNATAYVKGNLASRLGVNYYCILAHTNHQPPNSTYWYAMPGTIYEIPSPFTYTDLVNAEGSFALQFEQSADVLYIATGQAASGVALQTLTRYGNTNWQFAEFWPTDGPFNDDNTASAVMYASAQTGSVTLTSSGTNAFVSTDVGRLVRLEVQSYNIKPWSSATSTTIGDLIRAFGHTYRAMNTATTGVNPPSHTEGTAWDGAGNVLWLYIDSGYGVAKITAYSSGTSVTATALTTLPSDVVGTSQNITGITQANPAVVSVASSAAFSVGDAVYISGVVGMTQINNLLATVSVVAAGAITLDKVDSTAYTAWSSGGTIVRGVTKHWAMGSWSYTTGFPKAVSFFSARLFWGLGIRWFGSVPDDFSSYTRDQFGQVTTDSGMSGTIQDTNEITWMSPAQILLIGTTGGEWGLSKITTTNPLGPDNVQVLRQSRNGCRKIPPALIGTSVMYAQRAAVQLLSMDYNFYIDRYDSTNQNRLARHVTASGITGFAWSATPYSVLWVTLTNGNLIGYTYDKQDNVTAWHRHPIGGNGIVESVSVIPDPDGTRDELWMIVKRTFANGSVKRYVEYLMKEYEPGNTQASCFYMDCGLTYSGAAATVISGLSHLEGQTVTILRDGSTHPDRTVSSGSITLATAGSVVNVGLRCSAKLVTMRIEAGADIGTSQGKTKRVAIATIRVVDSLGGQIGMEDATLDNIRDNDASVTLDNPPPIYSGDTQIVFPGEYESDCRIQVQNDDPLPMTIVGIFPNLQTNEPT